MIDQLTSTESTIKAWLEVIGTVVVSAAGSALAAIRWTVNKYVKKIEDTEAKITDLQRTYVSRTELEAYLAKLESRLETQTVAGFNSMHRRLDELYQTLLNSSK
jgi:hypothetical protein